MFEVNAVDRQFFQSRLEGFLPRRLIDIHAHVWVNGADGPSANSVRTATWPARVAASNSIDDLLESYRLMLPGRRVAPVIFGNPTAGDLDPQNQHVAGVARAARLPALLLSHPSWPADELERRVAGGRFVGIKPYLTYAPPHLGPADISIFDFLPPQHLEVLDRHGWLCVLHVPRPARLRDPLNLQQLLRIDRDFPNARAIVAHVGRAYCPEDIGDAFDVLAPAKRLCFDISANTSDDNFRRLIRAVGSGRILFGSDLPIARMRMRRICESGRYVNLIPPGIYGDVSRDPNMREVDASDAQRLTFFLYEELDAFRRAADSEGFTAADVARVFFDNARRLLRPHWTNPQENA